MSTRDINRQFRLRARPVGRVQPSDFERVEAEVPRAGPGEAVARVLYLSLDPTNRIWMTDVEQYMPPVALGEVMRGGGLAQIIESNHPRYGVGDLATGLTGWQDYMVTDGSGLGALTPLPKGLPVPPSALMGALGITGITAYFGLLEIGQPRPGDTVVVSAAAGATGSVVGQIAKIKGCRVVGIAGGPAKCEWISHELGFDAAVDYKRAGWQTQLRAACPRGVDVDFENVGGEIMDEVLSLMNLGGRVVLCGLISGYNSNEPMRGRFDTILMKRLRVQGFIVLDFLDRFAEAAMQLAQWLLEGKLKHRETIVEGLEQAPTALNMLFDGANVGKLLIKVADPPLPLA
jgi:NADPH-dependent curcumin reductase CurA